MSRRRAPRWEQHGATFAVPDAIPRRTLKKGHTGPSFYGVPVRSKRICFVLDRSGSMDAVDPRSKTKATRFEVAAAEVLKTTSKLKDAARVNVVFFDTNVSSWRKSLASLSPGARGDLKKHLGAQTPRGETNLYGGLERAFEEKDVDTILVLSDGVPSEGTYTDNQNILYAVWRMNLTRRVTIHTVAVGRNSKLLKQLAEYHGGTYVRR